MKRRLGREGSVSRLESMPMGVLTQQLVGQTDCDDFWERRNMRDVILIDLHFEGWSFVMTLQFWLLVGLLGWWLARRGAARALRACNICPHNQVIIDKKSPRQNVSTPAEN